MKSISSRIKYTGLALAVVSTLAAATVTFDPLTGMGFVGKGDVQYTYGMNNAKVQAVAPSVRFRAASTVVAEYNWTCWRTTPSGHEITQERHTTATTVTEGLVTTIARERNQFTGFILSGYINGDTTTTVTTSGQAVDTCPAPPHPGDGPFILLTPAGPGVVVSDTDTLEVSKDGGTNWTTLLEKPPTVVL